MQSYKRDANGNITSFTDGEENVKTFGYDVNGKLLSTKSEDVSNEYAYNTYGNISSITHNALPMNLITMCLINLFLPKSVMLK